MDLVDFDEKIYFDSKVSGEMYREMQRLFGSYIWYRTIRDRGSSFKACCCSYCGGYFEIPKSDKQNYAKKHRDIFVCECCGEVGTLICEGRMQNYVTLDSKGRAVFVEAIDKNTVEFRCFYIEASYSDSEVMANIWWEEDARYILSPGEAIQYIHREGKWKQLENPREPWNASSGYPFDNRTYVIANPDELNGTFLEYADIRRFAVQVTPYSRRGNRLVQPAYMRYLCAFCHYPVLEYLIRYGCYDIIDDFIYFNQRNKKFLEWNAKKISDFCKMPKRDAINWISEGGDIAFRKWYAVSKNCNEAREFRNKLQFEFVEKMCIENEADILTTARYLIRQRESDAHLLSDYWDACEFLGRDLENALVRYPKNLREAHDEFTAAMNRIREETVIRDKSKATSIYQSNTLPRYKRLYTYYTDKYCAMVPEMLSDIALEGKNMHHCVAGYVDRHARGSTIIIFIRDPIYPLIPQWTAEISPEGRLRQVQGFNNRKENKPGKEAMEFIEKWLSKVKKRYKKMMKEMDTANERNN